MRILEILLPKGIPDNSISAKQVQRIDALQKRMDSYVDKILDPKTSLQGKEFLKSRLRDDYYDLKDEIAHVHKVAEDLAQQIEKPVQYEVYDRRTGLAVKGRGPYNTGRAARTVRDKLDNAYGGYRYGARPIEAKDSITEAIRVLPVTNEDFDLVAELMEKPIPAAIAPIYISEIIDDDEFNALLNEFSDINPNMDVRPHIAEWFKRVMPDQMFRFGADRQTLKQKLGQTSVIHGYNDEYFRGGSMTGTGSPGNAFGRA